MYMFNGQLMRMRTQGAYRDDTWGQTHSGLIFPVPKESKQEEEQKIDWQANASGIFLPVAPKPPKPTCISLFTGVGGFDLGFHSAGWRIVAATDHDVSCCWTYCYNMAARPIQMYFITPQDREHFLKRVINPSKRKAKNGEHHELVELDASNRATFHRAGWEPAEDATPHYFLGDVRKLTGAMILSAIGMQRGEPDCITGGPPCQGFSVAGRREVMDPRNSLVFEFARLILEIQPRTFVFENVPGIVSMVTPEGVPVLDAFCHMLAKGGYASYEGLKKGLEHNLNAWGVIKDQGASREGLKKNSSRSDDDGQEDGVEQMSLFDA